MQDNSAPATKHDLNALRVEMKQDVNELRAEMVSRFRAVDSRFEQIDSRFDRQTEQLTEVMRDMQTELLRAFHDWARPVDMRLRTLPVIEERLGLLEERVGRIERGNLPSQPR